MPYSVKEIYYTLQGEGALTGTPAIFCRFSGCNLWSGHEEDRAKAICNFCDTDFTGTNGTEGGKYGLAEALAAKIAALWPPKQAHRFVVFTGGEPSLQVDAALIDALHQQNFRIAIETNGTVALPPGINWICVSPKAGTELKQISGDELKMVYPQKGIDPKNFEALNFRHFSLSPMDGPNRAAHTEKAVAYCQQNPRWRLSLQTHKIIGIR